MEMPPRRVGKRLVGRYLFLRVVLGTFILILVIVVATFWAKDNGYDLDHQRSIAFNVLDFGAISICLSARFSYNSSMHPRVFRGNALCWWSVLLVAVLQVAITYIPGLNSVIFNMAPMDGAMWLVTFLGMVITFIVMEAEKALRRYLRTRGSDTEDRERDALFDVNVVRTTHLHLPPEAKRLGLEELKR
jgi:magnesium-transporting ATPase (P-type)